MTSICWKSAVTWSLLGLMFLLFVLMVGPLPALAGSPDAVLYEVTEDMYLKDATGNFVAGVATAARRSAVAQLSGWSANMRLSSTTGISVPGMHFPIFSEPSISQT